jgi:hypothetical protein
LLFFSKKVALGVGGASRGDKIFCFPNQLLRNFFSPLLASQVAVLLLRNFFSSLLASQVAVPLLRNFFSLPLASQDLLRNDAW